MNDDLICEKCGSNKYVIHHHIKYKEIHGEDKVIMLCRSCHKKIHMRLRKEGKCNIPSNELQKYSTRARRENKLDNKQTVKYCKENTQRIYFDESVDVNIYLREILIYNNKTNNVSLSTYFEGTNNKKLLYIDIDEEDKDE